MTELKKRIQFAKDMGHDFIAEKDGKYVSGKWDEMNHAEACGWKVIGSVVELYRENF